MSTPAQQRQARVSIDLARAAPSMCTAFAVKLLPDKATARYRQSKRMKPFVESRRARIA
jgi:hypothetical protein